MRARKPTVQQGGRVYPRVEVENGRIWVQSTPHGKRKRVPLGRARYIHDRLGRAIRHVAAVRKRSG